MKIINLSESEFQILISIVQIDITRLAEDEDFFKEGAPNLKEYIVEKITVCKILEIDFWNVVDLYCSHFVSERLKAVYNDKTVKEFSENYESPSEPELSKKFLKDIIKHKQK